MYAANLLRHAAAAFVLMLTSQAVAAAVSWDFSAAANGLGNGAVVSTSTASPYSIDPAAANPRIFASVGTESVNAVTTGWSGTNTGTLTQQTVRTNAGGLGVNRAGEIWGFDRLGTDNWGPDEMVLFTFDRSITISEVTLGWSFFDSDITVLAHTGGTGPDLATNTYSPAAGVGLTEDGWSFVGHYADVGTATVTINDGTNTGGTAVSSSYWLVGALNRAVAPSALNRADFVQIQALAGVVATPAVSEPASLALVLLAALLVGRKRTRRDEAAADIG